MQCDECRKSFTPHTWNSVVQLRQKVDNKRTFLFLEQLIIKHNAHKKCINIEEKDDGLNFYFKDKSRAISLMDFIQKQIVVKIKQSAKLISHDEKNGTVNAKFTIMIEIAPVCKDDLVLLPQKLSRDCGGIGPLVLCYKISKSINIVDVVTMETYEIDSATYWKYPFMTLLCRPNMVQFVVRNIDNAEFDVNESRAAKRNRFKFAEAEVQRDSDVGKNDDTFFTYTHLGDLLTYQDSVLGYDLTSANFSEEQLRLMDNKKKLTPDVVISRKFYPKNRAKRKNRKRKWKLQHLKTERKAEADYLEDLKGKTPKGGKKGADKHRKKVKKEEKHMANKNVDYEMFLQDLEEDKDMRSQVMIMRNEDYKDEKEEKKQEKKEEKKEGEGEGEEDEFVKIIEDVDGKMTFTDANGEMFMALDDSDDEGLMDIQEEEFVN